MACCATVNIGSNKIVQPREFFKPRQKALPSKRRQRRQLTREEHRTFRPPLDAVFSLDAQCDRSMAISLTSPLQQAVTLEVGLPTKPTGRQRGQNAG